MIKRFTKDIPTLPVGGNSKQRIFKEGQGIRWSDIKSSFLNQSTLDFITKYVKNRQAYLTLHLKKSAQEQNRIAMQAGA